jgi:hypothetical protein
MVVNNAPTLQEFIDFVRREVGISSQKQISASSLLEADLGITGDDGSELLETIQKHFAVSFFGPDGTIREAFDLEEKQYLFHSEGLGLFSVIASLFGKDVENVKPLSLGQLHEATCRACTRA